MPIRPRQFLITGFDAASLFAGSDIGRPAPRQPYRAPDLSDWDRSRRVAEADARVRPETENERARRNRERRLRRARQRHASVLAGGWGHAAQQAAWEALTPGWRDALRLVAASMREGGLSDAEWSAIKAHAATIKALGPLVARAWTRLLHQHLQWRLANVRGAPNLGGYPITS